MANNKSENINCNDCEILSEKKLSSTVQECIQNIAKKEGYKSYTVDVKDISTNGGNYLGILQTVDIKNENSDEEINLFVKNSFTIGEDFFFSMEEVYWRESFMYNDVLRKYAKLQEEYKVPKQERYNIVKSYSEINSEVIILENLSRQGFETCQRSDVFSLKFAEMSISQLAKFHALSFALQQTQPKYFEKNLKHLKGLQNFEKLDKFLQKVFDVSVRALEGDAKVKLEKFYPKFIETLTRCFKLPDEESVCLGHGDFRHNNILVKKDNGVETELFVVDYQLVTFTSPVLDLVYFIFGGTDQKFRTAHMEHLKDLYYNSFEEFLTYFNIRAEDVYSRSRFEKDFTDKLDFGLVTFIMLQPFIFAKEDEVPDLQENIESWNVDINGKYKTRIRECVDFFIQEEYL